MKKLKKITLNQLATAELNERELCRILGGGTPGCCQCSCNYPEISGTSANDSANNKYGYYSDEPAQCTQCDCYTPTLNSYVIECGGMTLASLCGQ